LQTITGEGPTVLVFLDTGGATSMFGGIALGNKAKRDAFTAGVVSALGVANAAALVGKSCTITSYRSRIEEITGPGGTFTITGFRTARGDDDPGPEGRRKKELKANIQALKARLDAMQAEVDALTAEGVA
jgi:hypothetical protein